MNAALLSIRDFKKYITDTKLFNDSVHYESTWIAWLFGSNRGAHISMYNVRVMDSY